MIDYQLINDANKLFGAKQWEYYFSPGRVNLIGEHLDYNGGFVLPCSLNIGIFGLIYVRDDHIINCYSETFSELGIITFDLNKYNKSHNWVDYIKAAISEVTITNGFDLYIKSSLPDGAGLSSSASLELLILEMLNTEYQLGLTRLEIIKKAQHCENTYLGVNCGIMDQFAIGMGKGKQAILLNTKTLDYTYVPCNFQNYQLIIANTNKKRTLAGSKYNKRRQECENALSFLSSDAHYLCDLTSLDFIQNEHLIVDETLKKRARHVIMENERSKQAKEVLDQGNLEAFGRLMKLSHQSLKNDYEVSCFELDKLVELFLSCGAIGARMTGAGFGGCIVALISKDHLEDKLKIISRKYQELTNLRCDFYQVDFGGSTRKIYFDINRYINQLFQYGFDKELLDYNDYPYVINSLMHLLSLNQFDNINCSYQSLNHILESICQYQLLMGKLNDNITEIDNFKAEIMDLLMDKPSIVNNKFWQKYQESPALATNYLFNLSKDVNYIQTARIKQNVNWDYHGKYGKLLLTINLSKPEKDPKMIAKAVDNPYPKCQLCKENIGFYGNLVLDSRRNLRAVKIRLNEQWFYFQYSPYAYFNEHAIVICENHQPMKISEDTFANLISFLELFPHYFIGSNADLPIVGGSILNHDHYQAGNVKMPIEDAKAILIRQIDNVNIYKLVWPLSTIRLITFDKKQLIKVATTILTAWKKYENNDLMIINQNNNTITPILRYQENKWIMDIILRNNYTNELYPYGIFHPHESLHHIKKENIGLIEAMGLAILPPRLFNELNKMEMLLLGNNNLRNDQDLVKHKDWITYLEQNKPQDKIKFYLYQETAKIFEKVLEDAGVFKNDIKGQEAFNQFIHSF